MAITTFWKFLQHGVRMGLTVTCKTRWNGFMLISVTINTGQIMVFGLIRLQQTDSLIMTSPAVVRWGLIAVSNHKRHMDWMAGHT